MFFDFDLELLELQFPDLCFVQGIEHRLFLELHILDLQIQFRRSLTEPLQLTLKGFYFGVYDNILAHYRRISGAKVCCESVRF